MKTKILLFFILIGIKAVAQHTFQNQGNNVGINTTNPIKQLELFKGDEQITNGNLFIGKYTYFALEDGIKIYNDGGALYKHNKFPSLKLILDHNINGHTPFANFALAGGTGYFSTHSITGDMVIRLGASSNNKMILTNPGGGDIVFATGAWQQYNRIRMSIKPSGFVGIGTKNPDELLTVCGTIHTKEVKVDLLGACAPDYVFENDYKLLSLNKLELYIKNNKHLPEIPSATEMEKSGMNLKEMNLLLLKKIEELTLHIIQLNKEIEKLKENEK